MFKVIWDNGQACGVFSGEYDTYEDANDAGNDWLTEMVSLDPNPSEAKAAYSFEVVESNLP